MAPITEQEDRTILAERIDQLCRIYGILYPAFPFEKKRKFYKPDSEAIKLLELMNDSPAGCTIKFLSEETGITRDTIHRKVETLLRRGAIVPDGILNSHRRDKLAWIWKITERGQKLLLGSTD